MIDEITEKACEAFGISYLFPWQRLVIANILDAVFEPEERNVLGKQIVLLPTGAGKSLCFQVPALFLSGPTLVIYPLLALMADQQRRIDSGGLGSVIFRGGQTQAERENNFLRIKNGSAKIIIANPEVLQDDTLVEKLRECKISHVAIDEAHCVSEWGNSFRPAYLNLGNVLKKLQVDVVTAFTATASPTILSRVAEILFDGQAHIVRSESDRPNIHYHVEYAANKIAAVLRLCQTQKLPMIIFCGTRSRAENVARILSCCFGKNFAKFYHAGLERDEKTEIEKWFFDAYEAVLCATCAYGMGVDKRDIKTVVHIDPPATAEAYIQEAGRGGRDGSVANAILLWSAEDSLRFAQFGDDTRQSVMKKFAESQTCRREILLEALEAPEAATVMCDGCDICNGTTVQNFDLKMAYDFIFRNRKFFTRSETESLLVDLFNKKMPFVHGEKKLNIWSETEVCEIIDTLVESQIVFETKFFRDKRFTAQRLEKIFSANESAKSIIRFFLLPLQKHPRHAWWRQALLQRRRGKFSLPFGAFFDTRQRKNKI